MRSLEHVPERFAGRHSLCQCWTATSSRQLRLQIHRNSHPSPSLPLSSVFSSLRLRRILDIVLQFCSTDAPTSSAGPLLLHAAHTSLHCSILIHLPFLPPSSILRDLRSPCHTHTPQPRLSSATSTRTVFSPCISASLTSAT